jgi:cytosine/adenosine deaminase-related metal-dependent hydrolase
MIGSTAWAAAFASLAFVLGPAPVSAQSAAPGRTLAIVGGTLIDGTGAAPHSDVTVVVEGDRIRTIGPRAATPIPAGAEVVKADGRFVVPGFIDVHLHYRDYFTELLLSHGITSVGDWGGSPLEWILAQKEGIAKGKIYGPRIFTGGESEETATDVDAALRHVRQLAARGVDKIDVGFGVRPPVLKALAAEAHRLGLPIGGYPAYAREAIDAGIDLLQHTYAVGSAAVTDPSRLQQIHHQPELPLEQRDARLFLLGSDYNAALDTMVAKRIVWNPSFVKDFKAVHDRRDEFERENLHLLGNPELQYLPIENMLPEVVNGYDTGVPVLAVGRIGTQDRHAPGAALYEQAYRNLQAFTRAFVQRGGHVLAGTDPHSFVVPGLALHQEMQLLVDAGLTPMQALQSASSWSAEYLRAKDIGTVQTGKLADLVILGANPLDDIRNTRTVQTVIQGGRVVPIGYHRSYANPIPRSTARRGIAGNPRPELRDVVPAVVVEGDGDTKLTVRGSQFAPGAVVVFDGIPLDTRFASRTELSATVPARLLKTVGTFSITVNNPRPSAGDSLDSGPFSFIVKFR